MGTADKRGRLNRESVTNSNWDKGREREDKRRKIGTEAKGVQVLWARGVKEEER